MSKSAVLKSILLRIGIALLSLFILSQLIFVIFKMLPGGPFDIESGYTPAQILSLQKEFHLDLPLMQQLYHWNLRLLSFDLGKSFISGLSVSLIISQVAMNTLKLGGLGLMVSLLTSLLLGYLSSSSRIRRAVYWMQWIATSLPSMVTGPILIWIFVFHFDFFPRQPNESLWTWILPVVVLSIRPSLNLARILVTSIEENISHPSSLMYRSYGATRKEVWLRWFYRGSLGPFLAYLPPLAASLLSGSLFVEVIFAIQGMGTLFIESLKGRDLSVLLGIVLVFGAVLMFTQLICDLTLWLIDPRVRSSGKSQFLRTDGGLGGARGGSQ